MILQNSFKFLIPSEIEFKYSSNKITKGHLISEWIYEVIVFPKIRRKKIVKISALTKQDRNPDNFFLSILGETMIS